MTVRAKYVLTAAGVWVAMLAFFTGPLLWQLHSEWRNARRAFLEYSADLVGGRFDKAYEFCGPDFRSQSSREQFVDQQQQLQKNHGRLRSVEIRGMKVTEDGTPRVWTARISADLNYENAARRFEFSFHKQDGRWLLYGYAEAD